MASKKNIAIVGIGRWGKNLLREFKKIADVGHIYHRGDTENSKWLKKNYPDIRPTSSFSELLADSSIEAIAIATPIKTHYELAKKALLAGKHVFVEKPITDTVGQAQELVRLAAKRKLVLFVGHIFLYHPVLARIKLIACRESIKNALFFWNKLGTFNEELVYNLLSHDVATALDLFGKPTRVKTLENTGMVTDSDIISVRLDFRDNRHCMIHINRVSNLNNKTMTLATTKNIYLWENNRLAKLDKKAGTFKLIYESARTPLETECAEFIDCVQKNKKPHTSGEFGVEVIKALAKI
ncbi:MAG: Gfo/Idh/MocA family oxidoreductase [Candidatus Yanofskybacteria bacterium]|nr:Gfo/Idh/MocA family oxidoreductase [Candidatus Yanofskybacteria bacterium]